MIRLFLAIMISILPLRSFALDLTSPSLLQADVQATADTIAAAGGGTLTLPAGTSPGWVNVTRGSYKAAIHVPGNISVVGAGSSATILTLDGDGKTIFSNSGTVTESIEYTGMALYAPYGRGGSGNSSAIAIALRCNPSGGLCSPNAFFRIHEVYFNGEYHGAIAEKRFQSGLIDNCTFVRPASADPNTSDYGFAIGQESTGDPPKCESGTASTDPPYHTVLPAYAPYGSASYNACVALWDDWWNDPVQHGGNNFAMIPTLQMGTDNGIFVENNRFDWKGSALQTNWASFGRIVVRYNTFTNRDGNNGGIKPGIIHAEIYNNSFTDTSGGGTIALYLRGNTLAYKNEFVNYSKMVQWGSFYSGSEHSYNWRPQTELTESYAWSNSCPSCTGGGYSINPEGNPERVVEGTSWFNRAPASGDRIYPYTPYTCPHPKTGLTGSCDSTLYGMDGYNVGTSSTPTTSHDFEIHIHRE